MSEVLHVNAAVRDGDGDVWIQLDDGEQWFCITGSGVEPMESIERIGEEFGIEERLTLVGPATELSEPRSGDVMEFGTAEIISGGSQ